MDDFISDCNPKYVISSRVDWIIIIRDWYMVVWFLYVVILADVEKHTAGNDDVAHFLWSFNLGAITIETKEFVFKLAIQLFYYSSCTSVGPVYNRDFNQNLLNHIIEYEPKCT